jgi:hypothetical protein
MNELENVQGYKVQAYKIISETHRQEKRAREEHKWKFLISVATVYALLVAARHASTYFHFEGPLWSSPWIIGGISAMVVIAVVGFLYRLDISEKYNLKFAERAERRLAALAESGADEDCEPIYSKEPYKREHWRSYLYFEIATFVIYAAVATLMIIF